MKLLFKFNLVFLLLFLLGIAACGYISRGLLQRNAQEEIADNARLLMANALAVRAYTNSQIKPLLDTQMKYTFLPQSVPAYSATEVLNDLRKKYPEYSYKEAMLNPTNPRDRAVDWEADLINQFRNGSASVEILGERQTPERAVAVFRAAAEDYRPGLPSVPQHRGDRPAHDGRQVRAGQRLRVEPERGRRRAGGFGADGGLLGT